MSSKIEWTDETWNPVVGCSHCSPGCDNCYAEIFANRLSNIALKKYGIVNVLEGIGRYVSVIGHDGKWNGSTQLDERDDISSELYKPLRIKKPRKIFVCSMGDLFHPSVSFRTITKIVKVQYDAPQHTYLWLTKRPDIMRQFANEGFGQRGLPKNVWCGVTVCNQKEADLKLPMLVDINCNIRFVSVEPMLGPIDIERFLYSGDCEEWCPKGNDCSECNFGFQRMFMRNGSPIQWVICGGESGPGARPLHPGWLRSIRDQCKDSGVPFMFKQWGEWCYPEQMTDETYSIVDSAINLSGNSEYNKCFKVGKKLAGRLLDGILHDDYPII